MVRKNGLAILETVKQHSAYKIHSPALKQTGLSFIGNPYGFQIQLTNRQQEQDIVLAPQGFALCPCHKIKRQGGAKVFQLSQGIDTAYSIFLLTKMQTWERSLPSDHK